MTISYEDFYIDGLQPIEEEIEEPNIPQNEIPIHDLRNDSNNERPLRYRSIQDVYDETNLTYENLSLLLTEEPCSYK